MCPLPVDDLVKITISVLAVFIRLALALILGLIQLLFDLISGGISLFFTHQQVKKAREIQAGPLDILEIVTEPAGFTADLDEADLSGIVLGEGVYKE